MRRRDILAGAALAFSKPAIAQGFRQLRMVTDWPAGSPGLQTSAERLAQRIGPGNRRPDQDRGLPGRRTRPALRNL